MVTARADQMSQQVRAFVSGRPRSEFEPGAT